MGAAKRGRRRLSIRLTEKAIAQLDALARKKKVSRAEIIRRILKVEIPKVLKIAKANYCVRR